MPYWLGGEEMKSISELAMWKADAIRLLGEKVKAEQERDAALKELELLRNRHNALKEQNDKLWAALHDSDQHAAKLNNRIKAIEWS